MGKIVDVISELQDRLTISSGLSKNPLSISDLVAYYDDSDLASITESGGFVTQINDQSVNGNDATQPGNTGFQPKTGTRTINGLNALEYDGFLDFLIGPVPDFSGGKGFTFSAVVQSDAPGTSNPVLCSTIGALSDEGGLDIFYTTDGTFHRIFARVHSTGAGNYIGRRSDSGAQLIDNQPHLLTVTYDGSLNASGIKIFLNGVQVDTADNNAGIFTGIPAAPDNIHIGVRAELGTDNMDGSIADFTFFNRELSESERCRLEANKFDRWLPVLATRKLSEVKQMLVGDRSRTDFPIDNPALVMTVQALPEEFSGQDRKRASIAVTVSLLDRLESENETNLYFDTLNNTGFLFLFEKVLDVIMETKNQVIDPRLGQTTYKSSDVSTGPIEKLTDGYLKVDIFLTLHTNLFLINERNI